MYISGWSSFKRRSWLKWKKTPNIPLRFLRVTTKFTLKDGWDPPQMKKHVKCPRSNSSCWYHRCLCNCAPSVTLCIFRNRTYVRSPAAPNATQIPAPSGSTWRPSTALRPTSPRSSATTCRHGLLVPGRTARMKRVAERGSRGRTRCQTTAPPKAWRTTCMSNPSRRKTLW